MKILHVLYESEGDYFGIGGVGIRAYEIYKYLKDRHDITLLCKRYPGAKDGEIEGLRHVFVGTESKNLTKTLLSYAIQASRFVKRCAVSFDVIIEDFSPAIPTFLHVYTKRPIILQIQGYTGLHYFRKYNPLYAFLLFTMERLRPRFYKDFIFISNETVKRVFVSNQGTVSTDFSFISIGRKSISIIPNGISTDLLDVTPEEGDYILYLGRIDIYGKGLDILLKAYEQFIKSFPDIRLVIAGDGRDRKKIEAMLTDLPSDISKKIELIGWVAGKEKTEILRKALFCVFPSRHEVQGITALEAMACGKAMIVSNIPEFRYITINRAGVSFKTGDANSLSSTMKDLMVNNERKEMGRRGRKFVGELTWERISSKFEESLYRIIVKEDR